MYNDHINEADKRIWFLLIDVPKLTIPWAYVCATINVFIPGFGTILCSFAEHSIIKTQLFMGIL